VDAVREAADGLVKHFFLFSNLNRSTEPGEQGPTVVVSPEIYQTPIERLDLTPRTLNCLKRAQVNRVGEVLEMSDDDLLRIRNFGDKSLQELREKLAERGIGVYPRGSAPVALDGDWSPAELPAPAAETDWSPADYSDDEDDDPDEDFDDDDSYADEEDS
jgi:DNA-directed RNA polymerase subunit alpha